MPYKDPERQRQYAKDWHVANLDSYRASRRAQKDKRSAWLREYKSGKPCADCGVVYPYFVMDLDHRPGEVKVDNVSKMLGRSMKQLQEEVAKCDLVCANCHRFRTQERQQDARAS